MLQPSYYLSRDCSQNLGLYSECLQLWGTACGGAAMDVAANELLWYYQDSFAMWHYQ